MHKHIVWWFSLNRKTIGSSHSLSLRSLCLWCGVMACAHPHLLDRMQHRRENISLFSSGNGPPGARPNAFRKLAAIWGLAVQCQFVFSISEFTLFTVRQSVPWMDSPPDCKLDWTCRVGCIPCYHVTDKVRRLHSCYTIDTDSLRSYELVSILMKRRWLTD
jgi:hypothetical protein